MIPEETEDEDTSASSGVSSRTAAVIFAGVWEALADILGTAATATLVRRAIREARNRSPELGEMVITRDQFEYRYAVPESWKTHSATAIADLHVLAGELQPLLSELTGAVVLSRLRSLPDVADSGLFRRGEEDR